MSRWKKVSTPWFWWIFNLFSFITHWKFLRDVPVGIMLDFISEGDISKPSTTRFTQIRKNNEQYKLALLRLHGGSGHIGFQSHTGEVMIYTNVISSGRVVAVRIGREPSAWFVIPISDNLPSTLGFEGYKEKNKTPPGVLFI